MTGEEKRRLLKEKYKEELKQRKEFLKKVEALKRSHKLNEAIQNITSGLNDDTDDWISKLDEETALSEAKMEMALSEAQRQQELLDQLAKEAEMQKIQAKNLVEEMKKSMGLASEDTPTEHKATEGQDKPANEEQQEESSSDETPGADDPPSPKKTLGDF
ncbi:MAG: hypothetical protein D6730_01860 [Bacteroidetes bacterium]|nr:MAG: hypothetical protein D6730_01860 [Bacteroidota bacterium]